METDVKLLTIHPLKEGQKENRIRSGRWGKIIGAALNLRGRPHIPKELEKIFGTFEV